MLSLGFCMKWLGLLPNCAFVCAKSFAIAFCNCATPNVNFAMEDYGAATSKRHSLAVLEPLRRRGFDIFGAQVVQTVVREANCSGVPASRRASCSDCVGPWAGGMYLPLVIRRPAIECWLVE